MKKPHEIHHHRLHRYSITGYVFGSLLLALSLVHMFVLKQEIYHPQAFYITLVPGICLLLRSHRPPIGIMRGAMLIFGGILIGALPILLTSTDPQILWGGLGAGLLGAACIGVGFSPKPEMEHHTAF